MTGVDHVAHVVGEAKTCLENGADGVLLCAWHLPPSGAATLTAKQREEGQQQQRLAEAGAAEAKGLAKAEPQPPEGDLEMATPEQVNECFAAVRAAFPSALLGVNYLRDVTCAELLPREADLLWTDYGAGSDAKSVEHARCVRERVAIQSRLDGVAADPSAAAGDSAGAGRRPVHFGAFAFPKSGVEPLSDGQLPFAAAMAKALLEVPTSSGPSTGVPIDLKRAARLRSAIGEEGCLAIASGVDEENCRALLPYFDVFLVNSSLLMTQPQKQGRHFLPWTCPQCTVVRTCNHLTSLR